MKKGEEGEEEEEEKEEEEEEEGEGGKRKEERGTRISLVSYDGGAEIVDKKRCILWAPR